jgi:C-terminal processing protease CtpA/Prc
MTRRWSTLGLVTFAAMAAGAPAAGAQQTPSPARVWVQCDGCGDDSLAVLRAKVALEQVTAKHAELARAMEEANGAQQDVLRRQMAGLQRQMMAYSRQLSAARPRGWIGLTFEGPQEMTFKEGRMVSSFPEYPMVVAVDPNSPADKAGVRQGDSLLAMNGKDLRRGIVLAELLRPQAHLRLRLRRDGQVRELPLTVARAPGAVVVRRMDFVEAPMAPMAPMPAMPPMPAGVAPRAPLPPRSARVEVRVDDDGEARAESVARADGPETRIFVFPRVDGLAGADMRTLDSDLGESFGVARGVLVVSTATSSPARESGLRGGDVILAADGRTVNTLHELRAAAMKANGVAKGQRTLKLDVIRAGGKKRMVTLRW